MNLKKLGLTTAAVVLTALSLNVVTEVVQPTVVFAAATFTATTTGSTTVVSGTGVDAGETVEVMDSIGDESYGSTQANANGEFTLTLSKAITAGDTVTVWVGAENGVPVVVSGDQVNDSSSGNGGTGNTRPSESGALVLTRYEPNETYVLGTGSQVGVSVAIKTLDGELLGTAVITDTSSIEVTLNRALKEGEILEFSTTSPSGLIENKDYVVVATYGTVTANYVNENGEKIADSVVFQGKVAENPATVSEQDSAYYYKTEKKDIADYTFVRVEGAAVEGAFEDADLVVTYVYQKNTPDVPVDTQSVTNYVDESGNPIRPQDQGLQPVADISGYTWVSTVEENGVRTHQYKKETSTVPGENPSNPSTPTSETNTRYVDESGNPIRPQDQGLQPVADVSGYTWVSTVEENGVRTHQYKKETSTVPGENPSNPSIPTDETITRYVDESGNPIHPQEKGEKPVIELDGYTWVSTVEKDGVRTHQYRKNTSTDASRPSSRPNVQRNDAAVLPFTGSQSSVIFIILGVVAAIGGILLLRKKKDPKK